MTELMYSWVNYHFILSEVLFVYCATTTHSVSIYFSIIYSKDNPWMAYCILVHGFKNDTIISQWWQKWVMTLAIPNHSNEHNVTCVYTVNIKQMSWKRKQRMRSFKTNRWIVCVCEHLHVWLFVWLTHTHPPMHTNALTTERSLGQLNHTLLLFDYNSSHAYSPFVQSLSFLNCLFSFCLVIPTHCMCCCLYQTCSLFSDAEKALSNPCSLFL